MSDDIRKKAIETANRVLTHMGPVRYLQAVDIIEAALREFAVPQIPSRALSPEEVQSFLQKHVQEHIGPLVEAAVLAITLLERLSSDEQLDTVRVLKTALEGVGLTPEEIAALTERIEGAAAAKESGEKPKQGWFFVVNRAGVLRNERTVCPDCIGAYEADPLSDIRPQVWPPTPGVACFECRQTPEQKG